jgi:hypothetical protein
MKHVNHQTVELTVGRHQSPDGGVCVMELASVLAGEDFSDAPKSVSPRIAALLRGYNDGVDHDRRQTLKRFAAGAVGTAGDPELERQRHRLIRKSFVCAPTTMRWGIFFFRNSLAREPYAGARKLGQSVAATNDDELHARMLDLLDTLIRIDSRGEDLEDESARLAFQPAPETPGDRVGGRLQQDPSSGVVGL